MRFGTLNVKGSLQGATGVRQYLNDSFFFLAMVTFLCSFVSFVYFQGDTFMAEVVRTFETYEVDVLRVT